MNRNEIPLSFACNCLGINLKKNNNTSKGCREHLENQKKNNLHLYTILANSRMGTFIEKYECS